MGVKKAAENAAENAQDEGNADGAAGVNVELFITEKLLCAQQEKLQDLYANDIEFQKQIDDDYCNSLLKEELQQQGCEAYDFLSQNFATDEDIVFNEEDKQDLWKKIQLRIK
ncbi:hypothetical protein [Candidatus Uabimicrobium sp. HlEnr_7]|uniref:hypothetical protein n=1 Tax=Candidatus Uabimicrobium helgolandensis TaxID=3095367 RepID=UPI003558EC8A